MKECYKLVSFPWEFWKQEEDRNINENFPQKKSSIMASSQLLGSSHWLGSLCASQSQEHMHTGQPDVTNKLWIRPGTCCPPSDGTTINRREKQCIITVFKERRKDCEFKGSKDSDLQKPILPDPLFMYAAFSNGNK